MAGKSLGSLFVSLGLDKRQFDKGMKGIDKGFGKLKRSLAGLGLSSMVTGAGLVMLAKKSFDAFAKQEQSIAQLDASLRALDKFTPQLSDGFKRLASELQSVSRYGDEQLLPMFSKLMTIGKVNEGQMRRVMLAAMDFGVQTGSLESAVDLLAKASVGYTGTLSRYGIILDKTIPESQKFEEVLKYIESRMGGLEAQMTRTTGGAIVQMNNALGDLSENFGGLLAPMIKKAATEMTAFFELISGNNFIAGVDRTLVLTQMKIDKLKGEIESRRKLPGGGGGLYGTSVKRLQLDLANQERIFRTLSQPISAPKGGDSGVPSGGTPGRGYSSDIARQTGKTWVKSIEVMQAESRKAWREMKDDTTNMFLYPITDEIEKMSEVPVAAIDGWRNAWNEGITDMMSRADDLRTQFDFVGSDIVSGWSNTMSGLMQGTMNFRDFSQRMFADVTGAFMSMAARIAAEKLFGATIGKVSFFGGGGGGGGGIDLLDYKYRGGNRKALIG